MPPGDASFRAIKHQNTLNKRLWPILNCSIIVWIIQPGPQLMICDCKELPQIGPYFPLFDFYLLGWRGEGLISFIAANGPVPSPDSQSFTASLIRKGDCIYHETQTVSIKERNALMIW